MYRIVFQISFLLLSVNLSTESEISTAKYEVLSGIKLQNPYKTISFNDYSISKCASNCLSEHDSCRSANYNEASKMCELNNQSPLDEYAILQEDSDWKVMYINTGSAGIGIDLYPAFIGTISLPPPEVGCRLTHTLTCNTHYRSTIIDQWQTQNIVQVKFAMYSNNYMVVHLLFDNFNTDSNTDWFSKDRLVNSSYPDMTASQQFTFFSISGDVPLTRRFYINKSFFGCPNDIGWVAVFDVANAGVCDYEVGLDYPYFGYSPNNVVGYWDTNQAADVLAIFIRRI